MNKVFKKSLILFFALLLQLTGHVHGKLINPVRYFGATAVYRVSSQQAPAQSRIITAQSCSLQPIETNGLATSTSKPKYIIAWDLHDVVLDRKHTSSAAGFISSGMHHYGFFKNIHHLRKITKIKNRYNKNRKAQKLPDHSWEEIFYLLLRSSDSKERYYGQYIQKCIEADQCKLNIQVALIIYELTLAGHSHAVLSNIALIGLQEQINDLRNHRWKTTLSLEQLQPTIEMLCNHATRVTPQEHNNWAHKPEPSMYHEFLRKHKIHNPHAITVFIDDKECNVRAAIENGFDIGIVYKNPSELKEALIFLQLL